MRLLILTSTIAALAVGGCGSDDAPTPPKPAAAADRGAVVDIRTFNFQPDPLTVRAGTTVTFVNHDAIGHTVTSGTRKRQDGRFDETLPAAKANQPTKATVAFAKPGRYRYICTIHPGAGMTAAVVVR